MRLFVNLTLGKRIILLTVLGLFLGLGVFSFLGIKAVNEATDVTLEERMTTARIVASYLDEALGRAVNELNIAVATINSENPVTIGGLLPQFRDNFERLSISIHSIYLLENDGEIISSDPAGAEGIYVDFFQDIKSSLESGQSGISSLVLAPISEVPVVLIACYSNVSSSPILAVAIDLAKSSIGGFVQPIRLGRTGYVEIVDQNGIVLLRTAPGPELAPFEKSDHSGRFAALIAEGEPTHGLCHTCHEPMQKVERRDVLAFVPLNQARWGVVIRQSENEALAPVAELRGNLILTGSGFLLIIFALAFVTTRGVVRRIQILTDAARRMSEQDLVSPIIMPESDEIGVLAHTFEEMRIKLKNSYEALEQKTGELAFLLSVSETLGRLPDLSNLDSALLGALDRTLEIMKLDIGGIMLIDEEDQTLHYHVYRGLSREFAENISCVVGQGISGIAVQSGKSVNVADISKDERVVNPDLMNLEGIKAFVSIPLRTKKKILGVLNIASNEVKEYSQENIRLLEGIADLIATAIENARLHREVQNKEQLRGELLKSIYSIQEDERRRIARELHDETSQVLASINASLVATIGMLPEDEKEIKEGVQRAQILAINILEGIHKLIYDLRPTLLDDLGLVSATRWLLENKLESIGIRVEFKTTGRKKRLSSQLETTLFRVIQEAVSNVAKHSNATKAIVNISFGKEYVKATVKDNGRGFAPDKVFNTRDHSRGLGLLGMKERVELVKGKLKINSRLRIGTEVEIQIPLLGELNGQNKNISG